MKLTEVIDEMIDRAHETTPLTSYCILLGTSPDTDSDGIAGRRIYRRFAVSQTRMVPDHLVVLAPSPDTVRSGTPTEYRGNIQTGRIEEFLVVRRARNAPQPPRPVEDPPQRRFSNYPYA